MRVNALAESIFARLFYIEGARLQDYWHDVCDLEEADYAAATVRLSDGFIEIQSFDIGQAVMDIFGEGFGLYLGFSVYDNGMVALGLISANPKSEEQIIRSAPSVVAVLKQLDQLTNGEVAELLEHQVLQEKIRQ